MNSPINCHFTKVGKGPGLFLIHGIGASEDAWRFVTPELEKYFTVITYDLRGHGQSSVTHKNFTFEELVNDLEQIRKQSKIQKAHFMGHSLGGMIAPAYAKRFPEHTISVGLFSTVAGRSLEDKNKVFNVIKKMENEGISNTIPTLTNLSLIHI